MVQCGFPDQPGVLTAVGPTLWVWIGFDLNRKPDDGLTPTIPEALFPALVDTGASESCIDAALADTLRLPVVDRIDVSGIGGRHRVNMHLAQIVIPTLELTITGRFAGVHLQDGGQPHRALIGRAFLQHIKMSWDGPAGIVTIGGE